MDLRQLREIGYLQEVNRVFFHPLGMALAVRLDGERAPELTVLDFRYDLEGMYFDDSESLRPKADRVELLREIRRIPRMQKLGYFVQPLD